MPWPPHSNSCLRSRASHASHATGAESLRGASAHVLSAIGKLLAELPLCTLAFSRDMLALPSTRIAGDALYAMELSLSLEKLNFDKLLHLWEVRAGAGTFLLRAVFSAAFTDLRQSCCACGW